MARGKVQMKRIENPAHRQVTFCKRRAGLLKKARELSVLCDAEIGLIIFSSHGKLYELATKGTMQRIIERYQLSQGTEVEGGHEGEKAQEPVQEISMLKQEIQLLQNGLGYVGSMFGGEVGNMSLDELNALEKHMEMWIYQIRSAKMQIMFQEIQMLKNKEKILKTTNGLLQEKIETQNMIFDVPPMITGIPYPLTIQNEYNFRDVFLD
ncbi:MADS-box transcription factor 26-like [Aristolochia californica]|uniref:MADS-box transcription factor 26-like n=1 Tax=Aristolochia californica TaxID=171875 RepID=UPI0035DE625A